MMNNTFITHFNTFIIQCDNFLPNKHDIFQKTIIIHIYCIHNSLLIHITDSTKYCYKW